MRSDELNPAGVGHNATASSLSHGARRRRFPYTKHWPGVVPCITCGQTIGEHETGARRRREHADCQRIRETQERLQAGERLSELWLPCSWMPGGQVCVTPKARA